MCAMTVWNKVRIRYCHLLSSNGSIRWIFVAVLLICQGSDGGARSAANLTWTGLRLQSEPADLLVVRGQPARLDCSVRLDHPETPDVRWMKDGVFITFDSDRRQKLSNGSLFIQSVEYGKTRRSDEGVYQCFVTVTSQGSIVSRKARLKVTSMAKLFREDPQDLVLYLKDTAVFRCDIDASPAPLFRWFKDDVEVMMDDTRYISHDGGRVLEIMSLTTADFGYYKCSATNNERTATSRLAKLEQQTDRSAYSGVVPSFVMKPDNKVVIEGMSVVLVCSVNGRDRLEQAPVISWLKDGITIDIDNDRLSLHGKGSLYIENLRESDTGTYICRATNQEDSVDTVATLIVEIPPKFMKKPQDTAAVIHGQVVLECEVYGVPTPSVVWFKNGEVIVPSDYFQIVNGNSLRILGLVKLDEGFYQCFAESEIGSAQATARLNVTSSVDTKRVFGSVTPSSRPNRPAGPPVAQSHSKDREKPSSPKDLRAILISSRFITVTWRIPDYPGTSEITHYTVFWREVGAQRERVMNTSSLEASMQQLKPATPYEIVVVAVNQAGPSLQGTTVTVETHPEVNVPTAPRNVRVTPLSPTSIDVRWDIPEYTYGAISYYKVYYYKIGDSMEQEVTVTGLSSQLLDLKPFQEYSIRVAVFNVNGSGVSTDDIVTRTYSDVPTEMPQNVTLEASTSTSLLLRWDPPPEDHQNGIITGYKIRYKKRGAKGIEIFTTDGNGQAHTITALEKGTVYQVRIFATNVNGSGPPTNWIEAQTLLNDLQENIVPGQPRGLQARGMPDSAAISWLPPIDTNVRVRGYVLTYGIGAPFDFRTVIDEKQNQHTIRDLRPGTEYVISLSAYNNAGDGQPVYDTVMTREETIIEQLTMIPPVGLKAIVLSSTTIHLTWTDTTLPRNQQVTDNRIYTVRYGPRIAKDRKHKYVNTTDLNLHVEDLKPNTEYEFSVKITKGRRGSSYSMTVSNTTSEDLPASYPRDLTPVEMENHPTWVTLNWQPPRYPNGQITGYKVLYTADLDLEESYWAEEDHIPGDRLSVIIDNLSPETTYYFKIQARNSKGYGPVSPTAIFLTKRADGTGEGGAINTPQDYGGPHSPSKKGGNIYDTRPSKEQPSQPHDASLSNTEEEPSDTGKHEIGIPPIILWVSIACIGGVSAIALVIIAVLLCKRRTDNQRLSESRKPSVVSKPPSMPHRDQPPDLWIHDHMTDLKGGHDDAAVSVCSSHNSGRHDIIDDMTTTSAHSDRRRSSFQSQQSKESGEVYYNRVAAARQPRSMIPLEGAMRVRDDMSYGSYPIRTPIGGVPRVNAGDISPLQPPELDDFTRLPYEKRLQRLPSMPISSGRMQIPRSQNSAAAPLIKKPPFSLSAAATSPMKPLAFTSRPPPDVTMCKSECEPLQQSTFTPIDRVMDYSAEELSAEMASLEGLMKDLNAIGTAKEYDC